MSTPRTVLAVLDARPGRADDLAAAITELAPAVRAEDGCCSFAPFRSDRDPGRFYIHEVYRDDDAFEQHLATEHVQRFVGSLDDLSTDGRTAADLVVPFGTTTDRAGSAPARAALKEQS